MNNLTEIMIFVKVVQMGNFSAAAKSLNVPVSYISRKISDLEAQLGIMLIRRTTRKMNLTDEGLYFFETCSSPMKELEEATQNLASSKNKIQGLLKITAPMALGRGPFIQFISHLMSKYPDLHIELNITNAFVDFVKDGVDVAIRYGPLEDSNLIAKRLGTSYRVLMATSNYLKKQKKIVKPEDLLFHDCIVFSQKFAETKWVLQKGNQKSSTLIKNSISANSFETVNDLMLNDCGIAFLPENYLLQNTKSKIQRVLNLWHSEPTPVHAIYMSRRYIPRKLDVFLTELSQWENSFWRK